MNSFELSGNIEFGIVCNKSLAGFTFKTNLVAKASSNSETESREETTNLFTLDFETNVNIGKVSITYPTFENYLDVKDLLPKNEENNSNEPTLE